MMLKYSLNCRKNLCKFVEKNYLNLLKKLYKNIN